MQYVITLLISGFMWSLAELGELLFRQFPLALFLAVYLVIGCYCTYRNVKKGFKVWPFIQILILGGFIVLLLPDCVHVAFTNSITWAIFAVVIILFLNKRIDMISIPRLYMSIFASWAIFYFISYNTVSARYLVGADYASYLPGDVLQAYEYYGMLFPCFAFSFVAILFIHQIKPTVIQGVVIVLVALIGFMIGEAVSMLINEEVIALINGLSRPYLALLARVLIMNLIGGLFTALIIKLLRPKKRGNYWKDKTEAIFKDEFAHLKRTISKYAADRNWDKLNSSRDMAATSLSPETAALIESFQRESGEEAVSKGREDTVREITDIFMYCIMMSSKLDFDLIKAVKDRLEENEKKYPASLSSGNSDKNDKPG